MASQTTMFVRPANPFQKAGVYSILLPLFVTYPRIFDLGLSYLRVPRICYLLVTATSGLAGLRAALVTGIEGDLEQLGSTQGARLPKQASVPARQPAKDLAWPAGPVASAGARSQTG